MYETDGRKETKWNSRSGVTVEKSHTKKEMIGHNNVEKKRVEAEAEGKEHHRAETSVSGLTCDSLYRPSHTTLELGPLHTHLSLCTDTNTPPIIPTSQEESTLKVTRFTCKLTQSTSILPSSLTPTKVLASSSGFEGLNTSTELTATWGGLPVPNERTTPNRLTSSSRPWQTHTDTLFNTFTTFHQCPMGLSQEVQSFYHNVHPLWDILVLHRNILQSISFLVSTWVIWVKWVLNR